MQASSNPFAKLKEFKTTTDAMPGVQDELTRYLARGVERIENDDPLRWWHEQRDIYPRLSRMAADYLSLPGGFVNHCFHDLMYPAATSVDVERFFSRGRQLLSYERNRLAPVSVHAILCVGLWSLRGWVRDDDIKPVASQVVQAHEEDERDEWNEEEWIKNRGKYIDT